MFTFDAMIYEDTLSGVLLRLQIYDSRFYDYSVFYIENYPLKADTQVLWANTKTNYFGEWLQQQLAQWNYRILLETGAIEDVVLFALQQKPVVSTQELVDALNHYLRHDGFLIWVEQTPAS